MSASSSSPPYRPQLIIKKSKDLLEHLQGLLDSDSNILLRTNMAEHITILLVSLDQILKNNNDNSSVLNMIQNYSSQLLQLLSTIRVLKIIPTNLSSINYFSLKHYTNLEILWLDQCPPSTISSLYHLKNELTKIYIYNSGITSLTSHFSPISRKVLNTLKPMVLMNSPMKNLNAKYHWTALQSLSLSNCGINYMDECFHFFPFLEVLDLSYNNIMHVVHLQDCYSLISLNLSHNRIRVLSNLDRVLGKVKFLNLSSNKIESLDGIDKLYSLESLNLSSNLIKDFNEVEHLIQLPCLLSLFLSSNPIESLHKNNYRLKIFFYYIKYGKIFNGFYSLPILDNKKINKSEKKKLKKIIYSRTLDTCKELTLDRQDLDEFSLDDYLEDDGAGPGSAYNSESEDESVSGGHGIRISFNNNSYRTRSYSGVSASTPVSSGSSRLSSYGGLSEESSRRLSSAGPASPPPVNRTASQGSLSPYSSRASVDRRSIAPISKNDFLRMRLSTTGPSLGSNSGSGSGPSLTGRGSVIGRNSLILKKFSLKTSNRPKRTALILETRQDVQYGEDNNKENYDDREIQEFFSALESDIKYNGLLWQKFVDPLPLVTLDMRERDREREKELKEKEKELKEKEKEKEKEGKFERERRLSSASFSSIPPLPLSSSNELDSHMDLLAESGTPSSELLHPSLEALGVGANETGVSSLRGSFLHNASTVNPTGLGHNFIDRDLPSPRPSISQGPLSRKNSTAVNSFSITPSTSTVTPSFSSGLTSSYDVVASPLSPKNPKITSFSFGSTTTPSTAAASLVTEISDPKSAILSEVDPYVGDVQYKDLNVLENLEVYLREQVFSIKRPSFPSLYLRNKLGQKINSMELPGSSPSASGPSSAGASSFSSTSFSPANDFSLRLITPYSSSERFIALYIEKVIDVKEIIREKKRRKGIFVENDIEDDDGTLGEGGGGLDNDSSSSPESPEEQETDSEETEEEEDALYEKKVGIVLTDVGFYLLDLMEVSSTALFKDTPLLPVMRQHPLYKLNVCTIYFGFQRCLLGFLKDPYRGLKDPSASGSSSSSSGSYLNPLTQSSAYAAVYMIVTRDKSQMYPIITRIPQVANQRRNNLKPLSLRNVVINNNDQELLDGLLRFRRDGQQDRDVVYYQMCFLIKKRKRRIAVQGQAQGPGALPSGGSISAQNDGLPPAASSSAMTEYKAPRSVLLTKFSLFLCSENLYQKKIKLKLVDSASLKDIERVFVDERQPLQLTVQFRRLNMFGSKRKWKLCTEARGPCDKLLEEIKRACYEVGNQVL